MITKYLFWTVLIIGVIYDVKWRKIPNFLTFGAMLLAVELNFYFYGLNGLVQTFYGLGLAFCLLFLPFALGGLGAGDVKYLMVVGAFYGPIFTASTFINAALIGGIYSLVLMIKNKTFVPFLRKCHYTLFFFTASAAKHRSLHMFDKSRQPLAIPYAVAISAGVLVSYWVRWV